MKKVKESMELMEKEDIIIENSDKICAIQTINNEIDTIIKLRDSLDRTLTDALNIIQKAKGRIIITGMLTDGDLRRCLSAQILEEKAVNIMTKNPITIAKEMLASETMKIMHDKKITNIFVIENKKPVGVIHIHDLLNNGVA